jgi:hypothetical protein
VALRRRLAVIAWSTVASMLASCGGTPHAEADAAAHGEPRPMTARINTLFLWCNDAAAMRVFYTDVVGLKETFFDNGPGWLTYDLAGVQVVFMRGSAPLPVEAGWAKEPAYREGTVEAASTVIQLEPAEFDAAVARAKAKSVEAKWDAPRAMGKDARAYFLRDPMGRTVELYCEAAKP